MSRTLATTQPLLSAVEQRLYARLVRALPGSVILSHVALAPQVTADFLVCRADFTPLAVVEIVESVPPREAEREKRRRKDEFLGRAGIKIVRVVGVDLPDELGLKALIAALPLVATALCPLQSTVVGESAPQMRRAS